jgi:hypothetical protein
MINIKRIKIIIVSFALIFGKYINCMEERFQYPSKELNLEENDFKGNVANATDSIITIYNKMFQDIWKKDGVSFQLVDIEDLNKILKDIIKQRLMPLFDKKISEDTPQNETPMNQSQYNQEINYNDYIKDILALLKEIGKKKVISYTQYLIKQNIHPDLDPKKTLEEISIRHSIPIQQNRFLDRSIVQENQKQRVQTNPYANINQQVSSRNKEWYKSGEKTFSQMDVNINQFNQLTLVSEKITKNIDIIKNMETSTSIKDKRLFSIDD